MRKSAVIAGAGLIGRLMALNLLRRDWQVTLYDPDSREGRSSAAYTGAGMLAPFCELESAEPLISELGRNAVDDWRKVIATLVHPVDLQDNGTLVVAHAVDEPELKRLERRTRGYAEVVGGARLLRLEPELKGFQHGLYFRGEGHVNNRQVLKALEQTLASHSSLEWNHEEPPVGRHELQLDCRGLGARVDDAELRGVRGEVLYVHAPEVQLNRPVRLMHPRYPLYVVPRSEHIFVVGATQIESDHMGGITVYSALELLSALYSTHPGFAQAEIIETCVNCRPAYPDNLPRVVMSNGHIRINGLYRHGYLLGPRISDIVCRTIEGETLDALESQVVKVVK